MFDKKIIVEGLNGSGKTSLIKRLNLPIKIFSEISEEEDFEALFYVDPADSIKVSKKLIDGDLDRINLGNGIYDRCVLSTLSFSYARNKIYGTLDGDLLRNYLGEKNLESVFLILNNPLRKNLSMIETKIGLNKDLRKIYFGSPYSEEFYGEQLAYFNLVINKLGNSCLPIDESTSTDSIVDFLMSTEPKKYLLKDLVIH